MRRHRCVQHFKIRCRLRGRSWNWQVLHNGKRCHHFTQHVGIIRPPTARYTNLHREYNATHSPLHKFAQTIQQHMSLITIQSSNNDHAQWICVISGLVIKKRYKNFSFHGKMGKKILINLRNILLRSMVNVYIRYICRRIKRHVQSR